MNKFETELYKQQQEQYLLINQARNSIDLIYRETERLINIEEKINKSNLFVTSNINLKPLTNPLRLVNTIKAMKRCNEEMINTLNYTLKLLNNE